MKPTVISVKMAYAIQNLFTFIIFKRNVEIWFGCVKANIQFESLSFTGSYKSLQKHQSEFTIMILLLDEIDIFYLEKVHFCLLKIPQKIIND